MDLDPVFLSRLQFAFVVSFHIVFPAFTTGLAAWLATIEPSRSGLFAKPSETALRQLLDTLTPDAGLA
jgi:hypothetical protein